MFRNQEKPGSFKKEKNMSNLNGEVSQFLEALNHPFRKEIDYVRQLILNANYELSENIKWNGPNYCYKGADRITMRVQPPKKALQLIFHRGVSKKTQPKDRLISFKSSLPSWKENDRAIISFGSLEEIKEGQIDLIEIINEWLKATQEEK